MRLAIYFFTLLFASPRPDTLWYGMYLMGNKVGYAAVSVSPKSDGFRIDEVNYMQVQMLGTSKRVLISTTYQTDRQFKISSVNVKMNTQDQDFSGKLEVKADTILMNYTSTSGSPIVRKVPISGPLFSETTLRLFLEKNRVKNMKLNLLDVPTATVSEGICELESERSGLLKYRLSYQGTVTSMVFENGVFKREDGPMGISIVRESKQKALESTGEIDITELYAVKPNVSIRAQTYLRLKLIGAVSGLNVNFGPQKELEKKGNFIRLEITKPDVKCTESSTLMSVSKFLEPDPYVQSDAPEVISLARELTYGIKDPCKKVEAINAWLRRNIAKAPSVTIPTALDVLREKRGDCNEHAVLFTALARASGIPTDIVVGLIYQDGSYYYHAWVMVFIGDRWIFVDPIFDEFPATVRHLALARGSLDKQTEIMQAVGDLRIIVEEQR